METSSVARLNRELPRGRICQNGPESPHRCWPRAARDCFRQELVQRSPAALILIDAWKYDFLKTSCEFVRTLNPAACYGRASYSGHTTGLAARKPPMRSVRANTLARLRSVGLLGRLVLLTETFGDAIYARTYVKIHAKFDGRNASSMQQKHHDHT